MFFYVFEYHIIPILLGLDKGSHRSNNFFLSSITYRDDNGRTDLGFRQGLSVEDIFLAFFWKERSISDDDDTIAFFFCFFCDIEDTFLEKGK
jgi:hypothetical protein